MWRLVLLSVALVGCGEVEPDERVKVASPTASVERAFTVAKLEAGVSVRAVAATARGFVLAGNRDGVAMVTELDLAGNALWETPIEGFTDAASVARAGGDVVVHVVKWGAVRATALARLTATGSLLATVPLGSGENLVAGPIAGARDGRVLVAASNLSTAEVYEVSASGEVRAMERPSSHVDAIGAAPDDTFVLGVTSFTTTPATGHVDRYADHSWTTVTSAPLVFSAFAWHRDRIVAAGTTPLVTYCCDSPCEYDAWYGSLDAGVVTRHDLWRDVGDDDVVGLGIDDAGTVEMVGTLGWSCESWAGPQPGEIVVARVDAAGARIEQRLGRGHAFAYARLVDDSAVILGLEPAPADAQQPILRVFR